VSALDRAVKLCTDTLRYGKAEEAPPRRERFRLRPLVEEVGMGLMLPRERVGFAVDMPTELDIDADRDQLYRVLNNLVRNATEALEALPAGREQGLVRVWAVRKGSNVEIVVSDNGPGVPVKARENLFAPFKASATKGGTGLGLAIAAELIRAHGGDIALVEMTSGAAFRIVLPDRET
jgi:signal transduction histidine kinase